MSRSPDDPFDPFPGGLPDRIRNRVFRPRSHRPEFTVPRWGSTRLTFRRTVRTRQDPAARWRVAVTECVAGWAASQAIFLLTIAFWSGGGSRHRLQSARDLQAFAASVVVFAVLAPAAAAALVTLQDWEILSRRQVAAGLAPWAVACVEALGFWAFAFS